MIVRFPGTQTAPRRLLSSHLDTVPICAGCVPEQRGRVLQSAAPGTGLGADNRAGVAVLLHTAQQILRRQLPHPPLTLVWTVQEEVGLQGARLLDARQIADCAAGFNWDGGHPQKLTIGATGGYRLKITVQGLASHAGNAPEMGINAITIAALAISWLQEHGWLGLLDKPEGRGTSNIGVIRGGSATNVVPDHLEIAAEARSHDPEFRRLIVEQIRGAFEAAVQRVHSSGGATGRVEFTGRLDYESFLLPTDADCVQLAQAAVQHCGGQPELAVANGGLDANWLTAHGVPTVSLGCGQRNQHMVTEQLDLDEFGVACQIALSIATSL